MSVLIAPSMLSANFANLENDIQTVNKSDADLFHLDIMDGVFVPNISYGFPVVEAIAKKASKPLDAHLMIVNPEKYITRFREAGVSYLSLHFEASTHLHRSLQAIKSEGMKAGVAINPHTTVGVLEEIITEADFILLMSVNPGFSAQKFIDGSLAKIERLKNLIIQKNSNCLIEVDGGVSLENAASIVAAGADILVAGNAVFANPNPIQAIKKLKGI